MAAETPHPLTPFSGERQANQLCKRPPFAHFGFVLPKMALYAVGLYRASVTPSIRSARVLGPKACGARAPCNVVRTGSGRRPGGDLARAELLCSSACQHPHNRQAEAPLSRGIQPH